ncbi:MAG: substrate-binding domain-containing protein [Acidimicrobiales bacterium]
MADQADGCQADGPRTRRGRRAALALRAFIALVLTATTASCGSAGPAGSQGQGGGSSGTLRVSGSTTVNPVVADAAEQLRVMGMAVTVDSQGGSAGGIAQLGAGQVDVAMSSKPLGDADREKYPGVDFVVTEIGQDAVGVVVRREVVAGGLTSVNRTQLQRLFEGKVANWSELGGPDLAVFVYDKEPGRGTREILDAFLYGKGPDGKVSAAPPPPDTDNFAIVGGNEETRAKLRSTPGSVGPLSSAFIEGVDELVALQIDGVGPEPANVADGRYPMSRPLFLITNGPPAGEAKRLIDFVLGPGSRELLNRHGYLSLDQLGRG